MLAGFNLDTGVNRNPLKTPLKPVPLKGVGLKALGIDTPKSPSLPIVKLTQTPDTFERTAKTGDTAAAANQFRQLFLADDAENRKMAAVYFLSQQLASPQAQQANAALSQETKDSIRELSQTITGYSPAERVALMQTLTGEHSPYARVTHALLVDKALPSLKDTFQLLNPTKTEPDPPRYDGINAALSAMAVNLLMAPVAIPTVGVANPGFFNQLFAQAITAVL